MARRQHRTLPGLNFNNEETMKKTLLVISSILALMATTGVVGAQEAEKPAEAKPIEIPKTKGAWMIVVLNPQPLNIQFSNAKACEEERARIKEVGITSYCIWVR